jgi:tRNA(fMet)-specific endonuclease VapC
MLDTNIVSEIIRNPAGRAAQRARAVSDSVCVSVIVAAELRYGCARRGSPELLRRVEDFLSEVPVLPFDVPAGGEYGGIRAEPGGCRSPDRIERSADCRPCMCAGGDNGDGKRR